MRLTKRLRRTAAALLLLALLAPFITSAPARQRRGEDQTAAPRAAHRRRPVPLRLPRTLRRPLRRGRPAPPARLRRVVDGLQLRPRPDRDGAGARDDVDG